MAGFDRVVIRVVLQDARPHTTALYSLGIKHLQTSTKLAHVNAAYGLTTMD